MSSWLVANPGCFTTTAELPLVPLLRERLIQTEGIIIDAKSGVSGAGRDAKQGSLFTEVAEGIHAYGVATHRHTPEIEQCLADFAGQPMLVTFTPHLMPMSRGILATIYVRLAAGAAAGDLHAALGARLCGRAVRPRAAVQDHAGDPPRARHQSVPDRRAPSRVPGEAILVSVLDNLVKGASGQAIQNMNADARARRAAGPGPAAAVPVTVTLADVQAARERLAGQIVGDALPAVAHAVGHHRRRDLAQVREPAIHRLVQGARRAQPSGAADARAGGRRA